MISNKYKLVLLVLLTFPLVIVFSGCKQGTPAPGGTTEWLVPSDEIRDGGPGKDGIPALTDPPFIPVASVTYLIPSDLVIGIRIGGTVYGFPHRILDRHEIINILSGVLPYILSYCPLTGTGMAWDAPSSGADKSYGVSGLLYNSNLILYDRQTDSYWSQMMMKCISGTLIRQDASMIHVIETSWATWQTAFPNSMVVSDQTGFTGYSIYPYGDYKFSNNLIFAASPVDTRLHNKERVHGVKVDDMNKVFIIGDFPDGVEVLSQTLNGVDIVVAGSAGKNFAVSFERNLPDGTALTFTAVQDTLPVIMVDNEGTHWDIFGKGVSGPRTGTQLTPTLSYNSYWFAWAAFFPVPEINQ